MKVVTQLMDHYTRLLQTEGDTYYDLVRNAYMSQRDYQVFLSQLKAFEQEVDRAIIERLGETEKLREKLLAEEEQLERMRKKKH
jgi:ABC-type transporter lipoprotein component MlaA